jgi:hypothetical protein
MAGAPSLNDRHVPINQGGNPMKTPMIVAAVAAAALVAACASPHETEKKESL